MYVYLIFDPFSKLIKIGKSNNPQKRYLSIRNANPFAELFFYSDKYTEKELHEKFKDKRVMLEWFSLDKYDLFSITKSYKYIPKKLHYKKSLQFEKRQNQIKNANKLFLNKYDYKCENIPEIVFTYEENRKENIKAFNLKTKKELKQIMKGGSLGFVLNGKFYSTTAIIRTITKI
jgi:hypothetical protein